MKCCSFTVLMFVVLGGCVRQTTYDALAERDARYDVASWRIPTYYVGSDARFDYFDHRGDRYRVPLDVSVLKPRMPITGDKDQWVEVYFDAESRPYSAAEFRRQWERARQDRAEIATKDLLETEQIDWWETRDQTAPVEAQKSPRQ